MTVKDGNGTRTFSSGWAARMIFGGGLWGGGESLPLKELAVGPVFWCSRGGRSSNSSLPLTAHRLGQGGDRVLRN